MPRVKKLDLGMTALDELFMNDKERAENKLPKIFDIPLSEIDDFPDHPYRVLDDEDMQNLMESIRDRGVITPAMVRKKEDGRYEMISGHRRKHASERLGLETLRCEVVEVSRDEAIILMVDSNAQRSEILPCDKGRAYKMKLDAIKRQGQRTDLTSTPVGPKLGERSNDELAEQVGDSHTQIQRYIRLTYLVPELQEFVDKGQMKMRPAVELSYLDEETQRDIVDRIDETEAFPSHDQAIRIRKAFEAGEINYDIPDNDSSYNFIVGMLYTQLFQQLYYSADVKHGGRLPVHVHFVMDEFANVALPDEFDKLLSTMRSREISVSIIIQNLAQLKKLFEKEWESIVGNCDEFLYLGGNEQSTHEYVSKLLGKETIDMNTYGQSKGRNGNYSTNWQITGRELMTPDEVRMLDNKYALLFIRGERPIMDLKYDILKHPNIKLSVDGGAEPYDHTRPNYSIGSFRFDRDVLKLEPFELTDEVGDFAILTEEEIEEILKKEKMEVKNYEENASQKEHH